MKTDKELLETNLGGITLKEMTTLTFLGWVSNKLNGAERTSSVINELTALISNPPMSRMMPDDQKLDIIRKLNLLGINI
jgi:hypothetical protein